MDNKSFEIRFAKSPNIIAFGIDTTVFEVISKPVKTHWIYEILYCLSLGLYDRRGWKYKVKVIK